MNRLSCYPQKVDYQRRIKFILFIVLFFLSICIPLNAHASLGGYETIDLYQEITDEAEETNDLVNKAFSFAKTSPYTVIENVSSNTSVVKNIRDASKTMALVVATLLLMVDFFRKSINFEWSSKWENILLFLVKLIVVKWVVVNSDTIVSHIYAGFDYINDYATGGTSVEMLKTGDRLKYTITHTDKGDSLLQWGANWIKGKKISYTYDISKEAVLNVYPNATFPPADTYGADEFHMDNPKSHFFVPVISMILKQPYFLIMKAVAILIFISAIGRVFELGIYTILAPLPISTFASDTSSDIAKNFVKKYIACVLQVTVMICMFIMYEGVKTTLAGTTYSGSKFLNLVAFISLGLGIMKSGSWSKNICGVG